LSGCNARSIDKLSSVGDSPFVEILKLIVDEIPVFPVPNKSDADSLLCVEKSEQELP
jgi:hypothetical protein